MSDANKTSEKDNKIYNPFEGRNPDEVWKELLTNSKPISREEFFRRLQEQRQLKEEKQEANSSESNEKDA